LISADNIPTSFAASGLPAGLAVSATTGLISGVPRAAVGSYQATISAINASGTGSANLAIYLSPPAPVLRGASIATGTAGEPFSYQMIASNSPTIYWAYGLPAGLSVNPVTGLISGAATSVGQSSVDLFATNASGSGYFDISIIIENSFAAWQNLWFTPAQLSNPAISGDTAMPAADGIPNLLKYALNLNPMANGVGSLPSGSVTTVSGSNYTTLTYTQDLYAPDMTYTPQVSGDMETWNSGAGYIVPVSATANGDGVTETVVVRAAAPQGAAPQFMRLMVTGP
jgi:hypothetical protein